MGDVSSPERFQLNAFEGVAVNPWGSIAYSMGNVPYLNVEENGDIWQLRAGQCLPCFGRQVRVYNPFSFPAKVIIGRGWPVSMGATSFSDNASSLSTLNKVGYANAANVVGSKKAIGFIAKRGRYQGIALQNTAVDQMEVIHFPAASPAFLAAKPGGILLTSPVVCRGDGTINSDIVCISGYYTEADITAWKTAAGYTLTETRHIMPLSNANFGSFSDTVALFVAVPDTSALRVAMTFQETGDLLTEYRSGAGVTGKAP